VLDLRPGWRIGSLRLYSMTSSARASKLGVSFRIGQGLEYSIEVNARNVNVTTRDLRIKGQVGLKTKFLHSGDRDLSIKGADDLTREKVGYLVKLAIDKG
jgi:hypothetical protein